MMQNDTSYLLSDLLASWYDWSRRDQYASQPKTSAMFCDVPSNRHWEDSGDIADAAGYKTRMKGTDFAINGSKGREGAMPEPHRTAIEFEARNIDSGYAVWSSPRLPKGEALRTMTKEARAMLTTRLLAAGIL